MKNTSRKMYYPTRQFDDQLAELVQLFTSSGWSFSGVDMKQLRKDALEQRAERADHDAAEKAFEAAHAAFGVAQEARYERFAAALRAARGAFRADKAVRMKLAAFDRPARVRRKEAARGAAVTAADGATPVGAEDANAARRGAVTT